MSDSIVSKPQQLSEEERTPQFRKQLRAAIESAFTDFTDLEILLEDELGVELSEISSSQKSMRDVTQDLLKSLKKGSVNYSAFLQALFQERSNNPAVQQLQGLLQQQAPRSANSLISPSKNRGGCPELEPILQKWQFEDLSYLDTAFFDSFFQIYGISDICLYDRPLTELSPLQEALSKLNKPQFFLVFIQKLLQLSRDQACSLQLNAALQGELEQLGSQLAQQHELTWEPVRCVESVSVVPTAQAYLLIALVSCNRTSNGEEEFTIWPELWLEQGTAPIDFENDKQVRPFSTVPALLSKLIQRAEKQLTDCECNSVVIEVFLPREYLEEDIFRNWAVEDDFKELTALGFHRAVVVRSVDRLNLSTMWQRRLKTQWEHLQQDIQEHCMARHVYLLDETDEIPSDRGALKTRLNDKTMLQLVLPLSTEAEARQITLSDIVQSPLPVAFWFQAGPDDPAQGLEIIESLINQSALRNTAALAEAWSNQRASSQAPPLLQNLRLLVEHPVRKPTFRPNKDPDDPNNDLLVAS